MEDLVTVEFSWLHNKQELRKRILNVKDDLTVAAFNSKDIFISMKMAGVGTTSKDILESVFSKMWQWMGLYNATPNSNIECTEFEVRVTINGIVFKKSCRYNKEALPVSKIYGMVTFKAMPRIGSYKEVDIYIDQYNKPTLEEPADFSTARTGYEFAVLANLPEFLKKAKALKPNLVDYVSCLSCTIKIVREVGGDIETLSHKHFNLKDTGGFSLTGVFVLDLGRDLV